jgi:hypothetical protein
VNTRTVRLLPLLGLALSLTMAKPASAVTIINHGLCFFCSYSTLCQAVSTNPSFFATCPPGYVSPVVISESWNLATNPVTIDVLVQCTSISDGTTAQHIDRWSLPVTRFSPEMVLA